MRQVRHIAELWDSLPVRRAGATTERARGAGSARWLSEETAKLDSGYRSVP
jgi:hypothetical protein